jgi:hypothetical protein
MDLGFRQVDAEGRPIRRTAAQVAAILQLPEKRCANPSARWEVLADFSDLTVSNRLLLLVIVSSLPRSNCVQVQHHRTCC